MKKKKKKKVVALAKKKSSKIQKPMFSNEYLEIVRKIVANQLTQPELKVFLAICHKYKADPIMKEIVPIPRNTKRGRVLTLIVTRDFLRRKAQDTKIPFSVQTELFLDKNNKPIKAKAVCWKSGIEQPFSCEVLYSEYVQDTDVWRKMPGCQLEKCGEVRVLKMAFGMGDIYAQEEVGKNGELIGGYDERILALEVPKTTISISDKGKVTEKVNKKVVAEVTEEQKEDKKERREKL